MELISTISQFWREFLTVALLAFVAGLIVAKYLISLCSIADIEEELAGNRRARSRSRGRNHLKSVLVVDGSGATGARSRRQNLPTTIGSTKFYFSPSSQVLCKNVYDKLCNVPNPFRCRGALCDYAHPRAGESKSCELAIVECLLAAESSIDLCMYRLSYRNFTDILLLMKSRGVRIRIVTDQPRDDDQDDAKVHNEQLMRLRNAKIEIKTPKGNERQGQRSGLMHNKYVIVDGKKIFEGSMNWSKSGIMFNHELVMYSPDESLAKQLVRNFEQLWSKSNNFTWSD